MSDMTNEDLVSEGLKLVDDALSHFMEIKGCEQGQALAKVAHGLLVLGEMVYSSYKK
jgi:hypothetical protein